MENPEPIISERVTKLLDLPEGFELWQDWDLIWADADRVHTFFDIYESGDLSDPERRVLMELIIASYDVWLERNSGDPEFENNLKTVIRRDAALHKWMLDYWSRSDSDSEGSFNVTPMIRELRANAEADDDAGAHE